jgi:hypothetical protein
MRAHPNDEMLPLPWKKLGLHLVGLVHLSGRIRYRFARNLKGEWCVILRRPQADELVMSPWLEDQETAEAWIHAQA